jgi:hypothetical protein
MRIMIVCQRELRSEPTNSLVFFWRTLVTLPCDLRKSKGIQPFGRVASQKAIVLHFKSREKHIYSEGLDLTTSSALHNKLGLHVKRKYRDPE